MWNPWGQASTIPGLTVEVRDVPAGCYLPDADGKGTILIPTSLTADEQRCLLAHKLGHHVLGHMGCTLPVEEARMHLEAHVWAAERLIDDTELADVMRSTATFEQAAARLHVTPSILKTRLICMA